MDLFQSEVLDLARRGPPVRTAKLYLTSFSHIIGRD
jgi:hypothetical protein